MLLVNNHHVIFVGIAGPARVGKDTFMNGLRRAFLLRSIEPLIGRNAHPLYTFLEGALGITYEQLQDSAFKDGVLDEKTAMVPHLKGQTPRAPLIAVGNFLRDQYGDDFLIACVRYRITRELELRSRPEEEQTVIAFVPDVRTDAEGKDCDVCFELHRDGCAYTGGRLESGLTVPRWHVRLVNDKTDPMRGLDPILMTHDILDHAVSANNLKLQATAKETL